MRGKSSGGGVAIKKMLLLLKVSSGCGGVGGGDGGNCDNGSGVDSRVVIIYSEELEDWDFLLTDADDTIVIIIYKNTISLFQIITVSLDTPEYPTLNVLARLTQLSKL